MAALNLNGRWPLDFIRTNSILRRSSSHNHLNNSAHPFHQCRHRHHSFSRWRLTLYVSLISSTLSCFLALSTAFDSSSASSSSSSSSSSLLLSSSDQLLLLPDTSGWPRLQLQPPARVTFYNQTGAVVSCAFAGSPPPVVYWTVSSIHPSYTSSAPVHAIDHIPLYSEVHKTALHLDDFHSSPVQDYHRHRTHANQLLSNGNNLGGFSSLSSSSSSSSSSSAGWPPLGATSSLRYVRSDGSLVFAPFHPAEYDDSVHNRRYRCVGVNQHGALLSREVHVKAGKQIPFCGCTHERVWNCDSSFVLHICKATFYKHKNTHTVCDLRELEWTRWLNQHCWFNFTLHPLTLFQFPPNHAFTLVWIFLHSNCDCLLPAFPLSSEHSRIHCLQSTSGADICKR